MLSNIFRGIGSFIFWTHERASWQYDLKSALILAFIFLTPRQFFHDRPIPTEPRQVMELPAAQGTGYRVAARVLEGNARSLEVNAEHVLAQVRGRPVEVLRMKPVLDSQGRVQAYTVWVQEKK